MSGSLAFNVGVPSGPFLDPRTGDISAPWRAYLMVLQRRTGALTAPAIGVNATATALAAQTAVTAETVRAKAAEAVLQAAIAAVGALTYTFTQATPAAVWVIAHNLNRHPSVSVVDSAGTEIEGAVVYDSANQVTVTFSAAFSGLAYLN